jgi:F-type H+-transporting ATPase subunit b
MRRLAVIGISVAALATTAFAGEGEGEKVEGHEEAAVCTAAATDEQCAEFWESNINWWSWDYKDPVKDPEHRHMPPPFGFALINFVVFGFIMYRLAAKPLKEFVRTRHVTIKKDLDESAATKASAAAKLREYEEKIAKIEDEVAALVAQIRKEAEAEKARIVAAAAEQAARLKADAEAQVKAEIARIQRALRREAVESALATAEATLREKLGADDQKKLADKYLAELEGQKGSAVVQ